MTSRLRYFPIALTVLALSLGHLRAQTIEPISADRPDQTESVLLVPQGYLQVEASIGRETENASTSHAAVPGFLFRYGLREHFELRLASTFQSTASNGIRTSGFEPFAVGMKVSLLEGAGMIPQTSFLGHLTIPGAASTGFTTTYAAPSFRFAMENAVSDRISVGSNIGAQWDGMTAEPVFLYAFVSGISITENIGCFIEVYGFAPQRSAADHRFDAGATWKVTPDLMIDLSGGLGLTSNAPEHFVAAGFSYRMVL